MILQELILTDDCLQHCGYKEMCLLGDFIKSPKKSNLVLIDLSRNVLNLDDHEKNHEMLCDAILKHYKSLYSDTDVQTLMNKIMIKMKKKLN